MQILHVYKDYWPVLGGIENHVKLLAEAQAARGDDVTVLVTSPTRRTTVEMMNGVRVIKAARLVTIASTPLSVMLPLHLARQRPDVAHLHFPYPLGEVSQLLVGRARHSVLTYHSDVVRQKQILRLYRPIMLGALSRVDRIIATSPDYVESSPILQAFRRKVRVVPFGIEQARFRRPDREAATRLRGQFGGRPILLFVGVLRYYKGLNYLLQAMPAIDAHLVIVGEGAMGDAWRDLTRSLGIEDRVTFAGRVSDEELPTYYAAADIFCLPASERSEAFGLVQIEAMASGLPVVSTDVGTGVSYVNRHMASGLVVPPRDPDALAEALQRLFSDDDLRQQLAKGALERADLFVVDRMLQRIDQVYAEMTSA